MFDEEDLPQKKHGDVAPRTLEGLSIEDLQDYIAYLQLEIERSQAEIKDRESAASAAAAAFKS